MRWMTLVALAIIAAPGLAMASQDGQPFDVSSQGVFTRDAAPLSYASPRGEYAMEIQAVPQAHTIMEVAATVTSRAGDSYHLSGLVGNAFFVSDVGRVVTITTPDSNVPPSLLQVVDLDGRELYRGEIAVLSNPALSCDGTHLVYRSRDQVVLLDLLTLEQSTYPNMVVFAAGAQGRLAGIAEGGSVLHVFRGPDACTPVALPGRQPRRLAFAPDNGAILVLDRISLVEVELPDGVCTELYRAPAATQLRDLAVDGARIYLGMRHIEGDTFVGEMIALDRSGRVLSREVGNVQTIPERTRTHEDIPWPTEPNEQQEVGNTYGEYQNYGSSYLHPGVDVMGDPNQDVFAVQSGVVKAVITTSGQWHWRVAIANGDTPGTSEGDLYAHLREGSIVVDVGDPVAQGQYIGDLVEWPIYGFTHCHFARIEDSGSQWYGDWLCTDNPHLDFENQSETDAPFFEDAVGNDLLAFCVNETSSYLDPDDLHGEVDIIAHVGDRIMSDWVCTVQEIRYTIYPVGVPEMPVVDDKLSVNFDMELDTYQNGPFDPFLVGLLYKDDSTCNTRGDYDYREFFHIITNSNGDEDYTEEDVWEAWDTNALPDGDYVVEVTIRDVVGNTTVESMVVTTVNGNPSAVDPRGAQLALDLRPASPAVGEAAIAFTLPGNDRVRLAVYDLSGRWVQTLVDARLPGGAHTVTWNGRNARGARVPAGVYLCRLDAARASREGKVLLLRR